MQCCKLLKDLDNNYKISTISDLKGQRGRENDAWNYPRYQLSVHLQMGTRYTKQ